MFGRHWANDYRVYGKNSLNKQITGLLSNSMDTQIIILALCAFEDVPIYALPATVKEVPRLGEATRVARRK